MRFSLAAAIDDQKSHQISLPPHARSEYRASTNGTASRRPAIRPFLPIATWNKDNPYICGHSTGVSFQA